MTLSRFWLGLLFTLGVYTHVKGLVMFYASLCVFLLPFRPPGSSPQIAGYTPVLVIAPRVDERRSNTADP